MSSDTYTPWPVVIVALKLPLMVWEALLVMKSLLELPVSLLNEALETVVVGPAAMVKVTTWVEVLPAASVAVTVKDLEPAALGLVLKVTPPLAAMLNDVASVPPRV